MAPFTGETEISIYLKRFMLSSKPLFEEKPVLPISFSRTSLLSTVPYIYQLSPFCIHKHDGTQVFLLCWFLNQLMPFSSSLFNAKLLGMVYTLHMNTRVLAGYLRNPRFRENIFIEGNFFLYIRKHFK